MSLQKDFPVGTGLSRKLRGLAEAEFRTHSSNLQEYGFLNHKSHSFFRLLHHLKEIHHEPTRTG